MGVDTGIVGLPQSGRTTVFNALTRGQAETGTYSRGSSAHVGVAKVPEPRLEVLARMLQPKKVTAATATYVDIGASVRDLATGAGGQVLNQVASADALLNVVRAFPDDSIPHPSGSLDPARDIADMNLELTFSDLALIERRLERIKTSMKAAKAGERAAFLHEEELVNKIRASLEKEVPMREMPLAPEEAKAVSGFQLLSAKPLLVVLNIGEQQATEAFKLEGELASVHAKPKSAVVALCAKLEMELGQLPEQDAEAMRSEYGLKDCGVDRVIKKSYELLGLITFFTVASGEVRAWPIAAGTDAVKAAGKIHSDMEKGFIRAEVVGFDDLVKCGSIAEAKKRGLLRLEGREYIVKDGDVITFLFNV